MDGVSKKVPSTSSTENDCNVVLFQGNMKLSDILAHDRVLDGEYRQIVEGQYCVSDYEDESCDEEYSYTDDPPSLVDSFPDSQEEPTGECCDRYDEWPAEGAQDPMDLPEGNGPMILINNVDTLPEEEDWNDYTDNEDEEAEGCGNYAENDGALHEQEDWNDYTDDENEDAEGCGNYAENDGALHKEEDWNDYTENEDEEAEGCGNYAENDGALHKQEDWNDYTDDENKDAEGCGNYAENDGALHKEEDWNGYTDNENENENAEGSGNYAENENAEGWNKDGENMEAAGCSEDGENEDAEGWSEQAEQEYAEGWSEDGENENGEAWADYAPGNGNAEGWREIIKSQWQEEQRRLKAYCEREKRSEEILGEHAQEDWYAKVDEEPSDSSEDWHIVNGDGDDSSNKAEENGPAKNEPRKEDLSGTESGEEFSEGEINEAESHQEESNKEREDDSRDEGIQVATSPPSDVATANSSNYESVKDWPSEEEHSYGVLQLSSDSSYDWGKEEEVKEKASYTRRTVYEFVEETLKENCAQLTEALKISTESAQSQDEAARHNPDRRLNAKLLNIKMLLSELQRSKDVLLNCYNTLYAYSILPDEKMALLDSVTKVEKTAQHAIAIMDAHLFKLSGAVFKKKFFY